MKKAVVGMLGLLASLAGGIDLTEGAPTARIAESGEFLEFEYQMNGQASKVSLPLYRADGVRYFSAGVGIEERTAEYPPFSLKIVSTAGGTPFLSGVAVTIQQANGGPTITIPREQVNGPWLFVDLPFGLYHVTASYADRTQSLKGIKVEAGKQKTIYLRWPGDRGGAAPPGEVVDR